MSDTLTRLAANFAPDQVQKDPKGNHYIPINIVQGRFDEVLGTDWNLTVDSIVGPNLLPTSEVTYGRNKKPAFVATIAVTITAKIDDTFVSRAGVGADMADDPDKVVKTALANAIKKAGHQFGVGRYLWDEDERKAVDSAKRATSSKKPSTVKRAPARKA